MVIGVSKLLRIVETLASPPVLQEDLTALRGAYLNDATVKQEFYSLVGN